MKRKSFIKIAAFFACVGILFIGGGYFYLSKSLSSADVKQESEPYSTTPQSCGIVFEVNRDKTFFYFDFQNESLLVLTTLPTVYEDEIYGYSVDFNVKCSLEVLSYLIDSVDGIDLVIGDEALRYTGVQAVTLLENGDVPKRDIIEAMFSKIAQNGFLKENFIYITQNCQTDITVIDCYYWADYMSAMCRNSKIIH